MSNVRNLRRFFISLVGALALLPSPARAQTCLKDHHEVKYPGGAAKLRDYLCKVGDDGNTQLIRVTFHRLNEVVAGSLVMGEPLPELEAIIGKAALVKNNVFTEVETLFRKFGASISDTSDTWTVGVDTPPVAGKGRPADTPSPGTSSTKVKRWYLSRPRSQDSLAETVVMADAEEVILKTDRWPEGFNHYYSACDADQDHLLDCTYAWRYLSAADLDPIERATAASEAEVGKEFEKELDKSEAADGPAPIAADESAEALDEYPDFGYRKDFPAFRHLTRNGWPSDFLPIVVHIEGCGSSLNFSYAPRPLLLDVLVLENLSGKPIKLDDLSGALSATDGLRPKSSSDALRQQVPAGLGAGPLALPVGGRIVIPTRAVLADSTEDMIWSTDSEAKATFKRIQSLKPGKTLKTTLGDPSSQETVITKTRESFLPPKQPAKIDYVYGPELAVSGLVIDGKPITFEGTSANFVNLTTSAGGLSCPYLYSFDGTDWLSHGKVIEEAREPSREMTEVIEVDRLATRFRIAEEEPEVSYIDHVELRLTLTDGRQIALAPKQPELHERDRSYLRILAYRRAQIEFALPQPLVPDDIARAELAITGYYRTYGTLLAELRARKTGPNPAAVAIPMSYSQSPPRVR